SLSALSASKVMDFLRLVPFGFTPGFLPLGNSTPARFQHGATSAVPKGGMPMDEALSCIGGHMATNTKPLKQQSTDELEAAILAINTFIVALIILWLVVNGQPHVRSGQAPKAAEPETSLLVAPSIETADHETSPPAAPSIAAPQEAPPAPPTQAAKTETSPPAAPPIKTAEPETSPATAPTVAAPAEAPLPSPEAQPAAAQAIASPEEAAL